MILAYWAQTGFDRFDTWSELVEECLLDESRPSRVWAENERGDLIGADDKLAFEIEEARAEAAEIAAYERAARTHGGYA